MPEDVDVDEVGAATVAVPCVISVHDLHIWALTSGKNSLTAHVVQSASSLSEDLRASIRDVLAERFQVFHTTLQLELTPCQHMATAATVSAAEATMFTRALRPGRSAQHRHEPDRQDGQANGGARWLLRFVGRLHHSV